MIVSGTMRFFGVLLVDRVRDLPGVVLRGLFPGRRWLHLYYALSPVKPSGGSLLTPSKFSRAAPARFLNT